MTGAGRTYLRLYSHVQTMCKPCADLVVQTPPYPLGIRTCTTRPLVAVNRSERHRRRACWRARRPCREGKFPRAR